MFQQVPQLISANRRRGVRGFGSGFRGLGDNLPWEPDGYPSWVQYMLANGHEVSIPANWNSLTAAQKETWINQSNLSAQDSIQLETESGLFPATSTPPVPVYTATPPAPGAGTARRTVDYVRGGDVIRVGLYIYLLDAGSFDQFLGRVAPKLGTYNLVYVNGAAPGWFSSYASVDVQSRGDRNSINDVASDVYAAVTSSGFGVTGQPTAAFVSKVEQTGGNVTAPAKLPPVNPNAANPLGLSTTNLLLMGAGGVLLLVVMAKR